LVEDEEPGGAGGEAGGGGGLEAPPMKLTGARFEISIDGTPRTHRDRKPLAIEAAEHLKRKHPHSTIVVKDLESGGEVDAVEYKPDLR
jgi:hypothetical protein